MAGEHLVLYDGVCGLCNGIVRFVLPRDTRGRFDFASLQSSTGRNWLARFGRDPDQLDTVAVVIGYRTPSPALLTKAHGVFFLMRALGQPWRAFALVGVFPDPLLNWMYDFVARHRYRVFGRYDVCVVPEPEHRDRFLNVQ